MLRPWKSYSRRQEEIQSEEGCCLSSWVLGMGVRGGGLITSLFLDRVWNISLKITICVTIIIVSIILIIIIISVTIISLYHPPCFCFYASCSSFIMCSVFIPKHTFFRKFRSLHSHIQSGFHRDYVRISKVDGFMSPALVYSLPSLLHQEHTHTKTHEKPTDLGDLLPLHLCWTLFLIPIHLNNTLTVFSKGRLFHSLSTFSSLWLIWSVLLDSPFYCVPHL